MPFSPSILPELINAAAAAISANAAEVTALDQEIGDGDHVVNLERGLTALHNQAADLVQTPDWAGACQKIGMALMSSVGGASGSLYGTLFVSMSKAARGKELDLSAFAEVFGQGVEAVKQRGKADAGEKTMLDVLIPVAAYLQQAAASNPDPASFWSGLCQTATQGMEATRDMLATKGRASFLGERSKGHIDAGAKTMQLMVCAVAGVLGKAG